MSTDLGDLKPVYLIYGGQELLLEQALERLQKRLVDAGGSEFDIDALDGDRVDVDSVIASANILPLTADRRLVIVRRADRFSTAALGTLAEYARNPNPSTSLVLVAQKMAKNLRIYKAVEALGGVAEYKAPERRHYPGAVVQMFADRGRSVGTDAAEVLVRAVGYDLRRLDMEISKVVAFSGDRTTLSRDDIEQVMSTTAPTSIFEFVDAIGTRNCREALVLLARLLSSGESIHGIHAMSVRHVRQLISVRAFADRPDGSRTPAAVARGVGAGMRDWQARNLMRQAERFTIAELVDALRTAAAAEAEMKTSRDPRLVYERWLVRVCVRESRTH